MPNERFVLKRMKKSLFVTIVSVGQNVGQPDIIRLRKWSSWFDQSDNLVVP